MAAKLDAVYLFICYFCIGQLVRGASQEGEILAIESNSPDAPFVAGFRSRVHRVRRGITGSRLTVAERDDFLKAHNDFRKIVNPPAANMQMMVWNNDLASMAQEWADACVWKHGNPDRQPKPFPYIGQNMYTTTALSTSGTDATTAWYDEVSDYTYDTNSCEAGKVCGHYTQVVWAKSNSLGCAITDCPDLLESRLEHTQLVVCNYGPGGNFNHEKPYVLGTKCSTCPQNTYCQLDLCARCDVESCQNGGTLETQSCQCLCPDGFSGPTCNVIDSGNGGDNTGDGDNGDDNTGDGDNGDDNTGDGDNEDDNTGDGDNGDDNTGDGDNGDDNTGDGDNGDDNTGDGDNGDDNTGDGDNGDDNTGDGDNGDDNTGDGDNGDDNTEDGDDENDNTGDGDNCHHCFFWARQTGYVATPIKWLYAIVCVLVASIIRG